jgi:hypothetical protein
MEEALQSRVGESKLTSVLRGGWHGLAASDSLRIWPRAGRAANPWHPAIGALLLALCAGCVTTKPLPLPGLPAWEPAPVPVTKVMALWADGVVVQPDPMRGYSPTPGFAGRIYLFGQDLHEPLVANGSLLVYLYDDLQPPANPLLPREVWQLDPASLGKLLKKDALGCGYNLWLPWSNCHPDIRKVTLMVCYRPENGTDVWSGHHVLPLHSEGPKLTAAGHKKWTNLETSTSSFDPNAPPRDLGNLSNPAFQVPPGSTLSRKAAGAF